ncbi:MAG: hypothetical protein WC389_03585 [Lutibacter sp.]|jgi:transcriptional regulator
MNKFDFTNGEWKYVKTGKHWNNLNLENIEIQYGNDGECICDTVYNESDARLIACSPEMLMALIESTKIIEYNMNEWEYRMDHPFFIDMEKKFNCNIQIIEKAAGKKWSEIE